MLSSRPMSRVLASSKSPVVAQRRLVILSRHMSSAAPSKSTSSQEDAPVLFRSELSARRFILNRPKKLNALDLPMLRLLKPKIEEWDSSPLCHIIIGTGNGRAFCAGGDVISVVKNAEAGRTDQAIQFFKEEFELDYALASLQKPYVALLDGITMGGGVGLSINALFRVATEKTVFAMPETKIGYVPDVGASFFMSRLDGALGTYLALTGAQITGRAVFELGIATHFVSSARIPSLLTRLTEMENATPEMIDKALDEFYSEQLPEDDPSSLTGATRQAIDEIFSKDSVEAIFDGLRAHNSSWATKTLAELELRSPTSLRVALAAIQRGRHLQLGDALKMELDIATAYCSGASPDFRTGVTSLLVDKSTERPAWSPSTLKETSQESIMAAFFDPNSPYLKSAPSTTFSSSPQSPAASTSRDPMRFSLPSEKEIEQLVRGSHRSSGGTACTLADLISQLRALRNKQGTEEKVKEVVARKCVVAGAGGAEIESGYLRWKP